MNKKMHTKPHMIVNIQVSKTALVTGKLLNLAVIMKNSYLNKQCFIEKLEKDQTHRYQD